MAASQKESKQGKPSKKESQPLIIAKTPAEEQRLKLEKLMRNPDKPAPVPERPKEWSPRAAPEFVRDVMGSSAGAGSGEFHVYRHLRRREYQRQDFLDRLSEKQKLDEDYQEKIKDNQMAAEERTAKRRKKREKLKQKKLMAKKAKQQSKSQAESDEEEEASSTSEEEEQAEEKNEREDDAEEPSFVMGKR
ncbi:PRKR-interacting protein 1 homolog [Clarias gariepinus]|uniref:PRKR-interacting protein 1 homolog n=1 Tax=Clarias gariepinus TaxID=13013 RepID=UPI00234CA0EA|nr:PRKR-interacting protein 1 homolog [Clarias gariepinus]